MRDRLRSLRYLASDLLYVVARAPRAIASGVANFWRSLPIITRRRLVAAAGAIAVVLVFAGLVVPSLPCALPGGDECAPDDDAIGLAPAGSLAYMHVNLDPETEQAERAAEIAARTPLVARQVIGQTLGSGGSRRAARGRVGALVRGRGRGGRVRRGRRARAGAVAGDDRRRAGAALCRVDHFAEFPRPVHTATWRSREDGRGPRERRRRTTSCVLGAAQGVRAVIDVATGADGAQSLADDSVATRALDELPEHRFAEAYLSADGIEAFVASPRGALATFEPLVDSAASRGAAVSLGADEDGLSVRDCEACSTRSGAEAEPGILRGVRGLRPGAAGRARSRTRSRYVGLGEPRADDRGAAAPGDRPRRPGSPPDSRT